jgi:predicted AAA+ superfamily ATPase
MRRKVEDALIRWKQKARGRLPLLLLGARQVGKTYSVERFAQKHFDDFLTINFQTDLERLTRLFEIDLVPQRIVRDLSLLYGRAIDPKKTLLVFDEVQLCQPALSSLKYFAEQAPETFLIATGSLFGIVIHRDERYSFPVGKVEILHMYPLDFEEYLWAQGHGLWAEGIRACFAENRPFPAHREAMGLYREYLMVGGLPAAVNSYLSTRDFNNLREVQRGLATLYTADMAIYLDDTDASRTKAIWRSVPRQLARAHNHKFKFADVKSGARQHQYEAPFTWLENAGLVFRHRQVTSGETPFEPRGGGSFFKAYLLDVGLLSSQMGILPEVFLNPMGYQQIASGFRSALAENYIKQVLEANGLESYYWTSGNTAEIDFLIQDSRMRAVPLEVKSADNVQSKSLKVFREKYAAPLSLRLSSAEFGMAAGIKSVPLYAAYCITQGAC